jgi:hypothetical protein
MRFSDYSFTLLSLLVSLFSSGQKESILQKGTPVHWNTLVTPQLASVPAGYPSVDVLISGPNSWSHSVYVDDLGVEQKTHHRKMSNDTIYVYPNGLVNVTLNYTNGIDAYYLFGRPFFFQHGSMDSLLEDVSCYGNIWGGKTCSYSSVWRIQDEAVIQFYDITSKGVDEGAFSQYKITFIPT